MAKTETTAISDFINGSWDLVTRSTPNNAAFNITSNIVKTDGSVTTRRLLHQWWLHNHATINAWVNEVQRGAMAEERFFDNLQVSLLATEAAHP